MNYFDLHCDTITECYNKKVSLWENDLQLCAKRGSTIRNWVQVYAVWMEDTLTDELAYAYFNKVYDYFKEEISNHSEEIVFCTSSQEIKKGLEKGRRVAVLAIEGSRVLGGKLEHVEELYNKGVRLMTLTWNGRTAVGDGCMVEEAEGLTGFGKQVISKMNKLGMLIDVSHLAEKGFWDVVNISEKPFIATHSNSQSVCNHPRNLTDEQFRIMVERKCLVGMNFYPLFINGTYEADIKELLSHIDHFITLGGEHIIAMGSDFDGAKMPKDMQGIQDIDYLYQLLVEQYGKKQADKFYFENANNFFERNL